MRDPKSAKASWMPEHFDKAYGKGKFEMVQVKDLAEKGCLDEAVKGLSRTTILWREIGTILRYMYQGTSDH